MRFEKNGKLEASTRLVDLSLPKIAVSLKRNYTELSKAT